MICFHSMAMFMQIKIVYSCNSCFIFPVSETSLTAKNDSRNEEATAQSCPQLDFNKKLLCFMQLDVLMVPLINTRQHLLSCPGPGSTVWSDGVRC